MLSRRTDSLVRLLGTCLVSFAGSARAATIPGPADHPKYQVELPEPAEIDATRGGRFKLEMKETVQWLGLVDTDGDPVTTAVWGYGRNGKGVTYPGPTFEAERDVPLEVQWRNSLPATHLLPVDESLHWANPSRDGGIPTVTHLHGGHTESASDGLPEAWFTQRFREVGPSFVKKTSRYDNDQEAGTLWYHDHALGVTRLNVYAGLAGFYLLRDQNENSLRRDGVLPTGKYEREIVIQDRNFCGTDRTGLVPDSEFASCAGAAPGQLALPSSPQELEELDFDAECPLNTGVDANGVTTTDCAGSVPNPTAFAEFFGEYIVVNGVVWPRFTVEPTKYRFRLLNGSDSRFLILEFRDSDSTGQTGTPKPFLQIGTDDGLREKALEVYQLVIAPGERYDVVFDFSGIEKGTQVFLRNFGPDEPFGGCDQFPTDPSDSSALCSVGSEAAGSATSKIMMFEVGRKKAKKSFDVADGDTLKSASALGAPQRTRTVVLFEGRDEYGRLQPLLGSVGMSGLPGTRKDQSVSESLTWSQRMTEVPKHDDVEVWEIYNATGDAHPIHLHLVSFEVLNRQLLIDEGTEASSTNDDSCAEVGNTAFVVTPKEQVQHAGASGVGAGFEIELCANRFDGGPVAPATNELGPKDTVMAFPGQVTRVKAKFDRHGRYVWHCHILSHEDHEMMRPFCVTDDGDATSATEEECGPLGDVPL